MECICEHVNCPRHLKNCGACTNCIEKCLKNHELPNCIFNDAGLSKDRPDDYYETFARMIQEKNGK